MPTTIDINNGQVILPNEGESASVTTTPTIDDVSQDQIDEIESGMAIGTNEFDVVEPSDIPVYPEETVYRKRIVKVVSGKIVAERIIYMKRYMIAASGGFGDGYAFLVPTLDPLTEKISYTPMAITLN